MAEILGVDVLDMLGKHSFEFVFPEDLDAAQRLFEAKKRGDSNPFRFRLRRMDGSAVVVDVLGVPMNDGLGMVGIVGTFNVVARDTCATAG